jgi:hypothetical protein
MSRFTIVEQRVCLRFSRAEEVMGILRNLDVPLDRVVSAEPLRESWWRVVRGWRLGFSLPRVRLLGSWRRRGSASSWTCATRATSLAADAGGGLAPPTTKSW